MKRFLNPQERKILVNSFVLSNFNNCALVCMFASSESLTKIESLTKMSLLHKRALRFMFDDYLSFCK